MNRTAILIDGGFFVKRAIRLWGKKSPDELAEILQDYVTRHLKRNREDFHQLYRIFYYDCPPINKRLHHPLTNRLIDFAKTDQYTWRLAFHEQLRKLRKMALRLGHLDEEGTDWVLDPRVLRSLISGKLPIAKLREDDFILNTKQKGVDMRIGVDIASMAYKKQVQQMILIAGDSDFVPAAKLARREGIDFILDPLWAQIKPDLFEHIDGLRTLCEKPADGKEMFEDAGKADMGYDNRESEDAVDNADAAVAPAPPTAASKAASGKAAAAATKASPPARKSTAAAKKPTARKPAARKPAATKKAGTTAAAKTTKAAAETAKPRPAARKRTQRKSPTKTESRSKTSGQAAAKRGGQTTADGIPIPDDRTPTAPRTPPRRRRHTRAVGEVSAAREQTKTDK